MKKSIFITMLLCLCALVATAQDLGIQGYYRVNYEYKGGLKADMEDPREYTEIGVPDGSTVEIYITEPQTGSCSFTFDSEGSGSSRITTGSRMVVIIARGAGKYCTLKTECGGKYLETRIYVN